MNIDFQKSAEKVREYLVNSYGPEGKTTIIMDQINSFNRSTRDGLEILRNIDIMGSDPVIQEIKETAAFTERFAGDGTTSSALAFINAICNNPRMPIKFNDAKKTIDLCNKIIKSNAIGISKDTIHSFVNTSSGKTLSPESVKELANALYEGKYLKGQYIYASESLYSSPDDALNGKELLIKTTKGFSFDYNIINSIKQQFQNQKESGWLVLCCKGELTKDDFMYAESYFRASMDNLDNPLTDANRILIICGSISHELSDYFSRKNPRTNLIYPVSLQKHYISDANKIIGAIQNVIGANASLNDLCMRARIVSAWEQGMDISEEVNNIARDIGVDPDFGLDMPSINEFTKNIKRSNTPITKEDTKEALSKFMLLLNDVLGKLIIATSVDLLSVDQNTISLSGFSYQDADNIELLKAKNLSDMQNSTSDAEKLLCKRIDILYSLNGNCKIHTLDSVGEKRASEIKDSIRDTVISFNCILANKGHFVKGACDCINDIIEALKNRGNRTDMLVAICLEELVYDFRLNLYRANKTICSANTECSSEKILDSSESIKCIINSIIKGFTFASNTSTKAVGS